MSVPFFKMTGAGNDFMVIDDRDGMVSGTSRERWADLCARRTGVGADGVLLLRNSDNYDFQMTFFNADGREGQMCGNGARCLAWVAAVEMGLGSELTVDSPKPWGWDLPEGIGAKQVWTVTFEASDGRHEALGWGRTVIVTIGSTSGRRELSLKTSAGEVAGSLVNSGVPHFVSLTEDPSLVPLESIGLWIRSHKQFGSEGANVNFVSRTPDHHGCYAIRTFERGVEAETLSCGTGAAAAAMVLSEEVADSPISIRARGGVLKVHFSRGDDTIEDIWLEGPVRVVYRGVLADI
jgi:diaminopimelate epimerase